MLRPVDKFNVLPAKLRERLNESRANTGGTVKYKFYIAHQNPDGERRAAGELIYPMTYTLTPVTFSIMYDGAMLTIGMTDGKMQFDGEKEGWHFRRVQVIEREQGIKTLDLSIPEHIEMFEYLELHPKLEGGLFRDTKAPAMFVRVDELKESKTKLRLKENRSAALMVATRMNEQEVRNFAAAMNWNELADLDILKDKMTEIADKDPDFFRKFVDDPRQEYKATIKRAMDQNIVSFVPTEHKFIWASNGSTIAVLERADGMNFLDQMADWVMAHKNGQETYKKIRSLQLGKQV
jgi:hypothetical protein